MDVVPPLGHPTLHSSPTGQGTAASDAAEPPSGKSAPPSPVSDGAPSPDEPPSLLATPPNPLCAFPHAQTMDSATATATAHLEPLVCRRLRLLICVLLGEIREIASMGASTRAVGRQARFQGAHEPRLLAGPPVTSRVTAGRRRGKWHVARSRPSESPSRFTDARWRPTWPTPSGRR